MNPYNFVIYHQKITKVATTTTVTTTTTTTILCLLALAVLLEDLRNDVSEVKPKLRRN